MSKHALCVIATAAALSAAVFGCGSVEQVASPITENVTSKAQETEQLPPELSLKENQKYAADVSEEFADLADENGVITALLLNEMSSDEIAQISDEEARAVCAVYIDDYRKTYGIAADYEMTHEDWNMIKMFMAYQITGQLPKMEEVLSTDEQQSDDTFVGISNEDVKEAVDCATTEEFREFVEGVAQDSGDIELQQSVHEMSDEEIEELRIAYIEWLEEDISANDN